eukprot:scaffold32737_cov66-Cyclotella_meneghiniana.AAC.3
MVRSKCTESSKIEPLNCGLWVVGRPTSERRMSRILIQPAGRCILVADEASVTPRLGERATVTAPYFFPPLFPILPATTEPQKNMKETRLTQPHTKRNTT